ncbi:ABC transporter ATP-binding protein [Oceaniglobus trochenteri]|uniref:ABC transporter ATP-binding protein n=1 Tax=Oceaniglobus trochenteri TaxID=2763260 RepID=UPI001CFF9FBA|nr:ABC transporter ATP-binding protein [Oceaniglobus trochenteri]
MSVRDDPLLRLDRVSVALRQGGREMVSGVSLSVGRRELFGIVGESGSGKTLFTRTVFGLHDDAVVSGGEVTFDGRTMPAKSHHTEMKRLLGKRIGFIPQDPFSSLNPSMRVGAQITEALYLARGLSPKSREARDAAIAVLAEVGIPEPDIAFRQFPDQFSGGMRQRIVIAIVLAQEPELLIADEPTTALDASTQRLIVDLIVERSRTRGLSVILISHNLELLRQSMDRIGVLYSGQFLNLFQADQLAHQEVHPYTQALFDCIPTKDKTLADIRPIPGEPAGAGFGLAGCSFADRCAFAKDRCCATPLPINDAGQARFSACIIGKGA